MTSNTDDVAYFKKVIDILIEKYRADESQIFVTGWSNGGYMTYRLACELSDKIAGGAPFVGSFGWKKTEMGQCIGTKIIHEEPLLFLEEYILDTYTWDTEKCSYEMWKNDLPEIYSCEQEKEVPLLII